MAESGEEKRIRLLLESVKPPAGDYPDWRRGLRWSIAGALIGVFPGGILKLTGFHISSIIGIMLVILISFGAIGAFRPPLEK